MKRSLLGIAAVSFVVGSTAFAFADKRGYDPLALDHFVEANLAIATSSVSPGRKSLGNGAEQLTLAGNGLHYDGNGYLIGPDGKRVKNQLRIRWQVGVFR